MEIPLYQVDAFASEVFHGNPAAVCPLDDWLPAETLAAIAAENNLAETAFLVGGRGRYRLRWFTPTVELDLCGHATLASAFVVFQILEGDRKLSEVLFDSASGPLPVRRDGEVLTLDFPARPPAPVEPPAGLAEALGAKPMETRLSRDLLALFASENHVRSLTPDFRKLSRLERSVVATAPGRDCDFVSRFFAPNFGIDEDPVTGSSHSTLIPYWARRLGKTRLHARQVSARGGELFCEDRGERVSIGGRAVLFLTGTIHL
jgi:PhzF family phenazine biosynthesis protein